MRLWCRRWIGGAPRGSTAVFVGVAQCSTVGTGLLSGAQNAELVAFWILKYSPRPLALTNIDPAGTQSDHPLDLGRWIVRPEIQVKTILRYLRIGHRHEDQPRQPVRCRTNFELIVSFQSHDPTQSCGPPKSKLSRSCRIDNYLFPFKTHACHSTEPDWFDGRLGDRRDSSPAPSLSVTRSTDEFITASSHPCGAGKCICARCGPTLGSRHGAAGSPPCDSIARGQATRYSINAGLGRRNTAGDAYQ